MKKIFNKFVLFSTAILLVFSLVGLAGCNNGPNGLSILQQADNLGQQVYAATNGENTSMSEIDALLLELAQLRAEVERLQGENKALLERIDDYKTKLTNFRVVSLQAQIAELVKQLEELGVENAQLQQRLESLQRQLAYMNNGEIAFNFHDRSLLFCVSRSMFEVEDVAELNSLLKNNNPSGIPFVYERNEFYQNRYTANFFASYRLLIMLTGGGSLCTFEVERITLDGTIYITHVIGPLMDVSISSILIELPNTFRPYQFQRNITIARR